METMQSISCIVFNAYGVRSIVLPSRSYEVYHVAGDSPSRAALGARYTRIYIMNI